ncbi:unnamed protein product [Closterium sp. NIES-53]
MSSSVGPAERERRPTAKILVCKDYARGRCSRSDCRFAHTSSTLGVEPSDEGDVVSVCNDFLRSRCARATSCRYFHPPPHLVRYFFTQWLVCRDFLKGRCSREASVCRYAHTNPNAGDGNLVTVCQDFLKNRCERASCRYYHPEEALRSRIKDVPVSRPGQGMEMDPYQAAYSAYAVASMYENQAAAAKRMRMEEGGAPGVGNAAAVASLGGDDDRVRKSGLDPPFSPFTFSWPFPVPIVSFHPFPFHSPTLIAVILPFRLPVRSRPIPSRDFLCRAVPCAFFPSSSPTPPTPSTPPTPPNSTTPCVLSPGAAVAQDRLPVCRDFINGKCVRGACRYVHPDEHVQVADGHVTLCRDAARNKCERENCRFYHPTKPSGGEM